MLTDAKIAAIKPPTVGQQEHPDNKVTGLRLRVGAGGKKTWTVRRRVGAKIVNKKIGTYPPMGLAAARKAAERLIEALERDGSTESLDRTFGEVADFWIEKVAKLKNDSWHDQKRQLEMHVLPTWRGRKIAAIKRADVRELLDGIEGVVLPNRVLATVKTIFRFALSRDWLEASPVEGIAKPNDETQRDRVLDMGEIKRVWNASALIGYPFGFLVQMLLLTAQRRTEVASMRWEDVDLEVGKWILRSEDTKAERTHLVPLSPAAKAILELVPRLGPYVFTTDGETYVRSFSKGKKRLDDFLTAGEGPLTSWRLHDLRRSAATHMVRLGVSETIVGRILNHAQQGVTAKVYALHSYAPEKRHALDTWAAEVDRAVNGDRGGNVFPLRADA
ncbi:site-specific integrase [Parafrankia sp. BMG5.11]|uniref:tyrosine-type recombinase/integrase n=1 Tax=Parafrankia sp. BMG5.11 TaxID=222540 RepID=UPI00103D9D25|nr:site-specific integrase [Parafrankia sp. BMG5.11]TCJ39199.1 site-specific integrase [Parafrankia sp. BMG5.11]